MRWRLRFQWLPLNVLNEAYNLGSVKDNAIYQLRTGPKLIRPTTTVEEAGVGLEMAGV